MDAEMTWAKGTAAGGFQAVVSCIAGSCEPTACFTATAEAVTELVRWL